MPGFVTHYIFGVNTYKDSVTDSDVRRIIKRHPNAFALGLLGPDLFFHYAPMDMGIRPNIANIIHKRRTGSFFYHLIRSVTLLSDAYEYETAVAYIEGFLGHYVLDTTMHPYVYCKVGTSTKRETLGTHFALETDIDREVLFRYKGISQADFSHAGALVLSLKEQKTVASLLNYAIKANYGLDISATLIKSIIFCLPIECALRTDRKFYKQKLITTFENIFFGYKILSPLLINNASYLDDPCNENHNEWHNPWDDSVKSTDSIYDILEKEQKSYAAYMNAMKSALDNAFNGCIPPKNRIIKLFGNKSYSSGLDCRIELTREP